jgi:hypothetical protein
MPLPDDIRAIWDDLRETRRRDDRMRPRVRDRRAPDDEFELCPYLECSSVYARPVFSIPGGWKFLMMPVQPEVSWSPTITVWNSGTFPTWACHVEVRENPGDILKAQTIITLQPGESRDVILPVTTGQDDTSLLGICYDPLFDPYDPQDPSDRKVTRLALIMALALRAPGPVNIRDNDAISRLLQPE